MHADLVKLGYDGPYERVVAFARAWRTDRQRVEQTIGRGTFVPLVFQPGEAFQFDWSGDWATVAGDVLNCRWPISSFLTAEPFLYERIPSNP